MAKTEVVPQPAVVQPKFVSDSAANLSVATFVAWLITQLASVFPFLAWPGVGWLIGLFVNPLLTAAINQLLLLLNINIIELVIDKQKEAYAAAVAKLSTVITNPSASEAQMDAAKQAFKDAFKNLIQVNVKFVLSSRTH